MASQHRKSSNGRNTDPRTASLEGVHVHDVTGARAVRTAQRSLEILLQMRSKSIQWAGIHAGAGSRADSGSR